MMPDASSRSPVQIRLASWGELADALVRGLAHALSNRVGALMALIDLEPDDLSPEDRRLVPREVDRLQDINRLLKLLPAEIESRSQAVLPRDVLSDAIALIGMHPQAKEITFELKASSDQPVRVERWALLRLTLILFDAARQMTVASRGDRVCVTISGDDRELLLRIEWRAGDVPDVDEDNVRDLLAQTQATLETSPAALTLKLPTLLEQRRRERERGS